MSSDNHGRTYPKPFMTTKRRLTTDTVQIPPPAERSVHEQLDSMIAAIAAAIAMAPGTDSSNSSDAEDQPTAAATAHVRWEQCSQCHRCHDPSKRCRCYACGNIHLADHPCSTANSAALRCAICNRIHAPGPCDPHGGPVSVYCGQCGRSHLPGSRCRCRTCGRVHDASNDCQLVIVRSEHDVFEGAALTRGHVTAYDKGAPTEECPNCGALFFEHEARYVNCCRKGTIVVPQKAIPSALLALITDSHVHTHIRQYNAAVAMASVGYSGDALGRNANAPGRPYVDGYGRIHDMFAYCISLLLQVH